METRFTNFLARLSRLCLYAIVFLVPLIYLPFTPEKFELSKYFLFYFLTLLSLLAYLLRAVTIKNFTIRRTPLDLPLLILWLLYLAASILSMQRYLSFFGNFSLLGQSFVGFSLLLVFYFLVVQHLDSIRQLLAMLYTLLASGALAIAYFIATLLHVPFPSWLPAGNVISLSYLLFGVFAAVLFVLATALLAIRRTAAPFLAAVIAVWLLSGSAIMMLGFKIIWIIIAIALFGLLVFFLTYLDEVRSWWSSAAFGLLLASLLFIFLGTPKLLTAPVPAEFALNASTSFTIALQTLTDGAKQFLFGSGPATYVYDFSHYRPEIMNQNFAWNVRFQQPLSTAFEWLTTNGLLANLALLAILLIVVGLIAATWLNHLTDLRRKRKVEGASVAAAMEWQRSPLLFWAVVGSWLTLLVSLFMINFGAVHWVLFWLFTALIVSASALVGRNVLSLQSVSLKTTPQYALVSSFSFILLFTAIIVAGIYLGRFYAAEVVYARSLNKPLNEKIAGIQNAVALNGYRESFYLAIADALVADAAQISQNKGEPVGVYQRVSQAVAAARQAAAIAPRNVATWDFLSVLYANARPLAPEAAVWMASSLHTAIELEPTNPSLYLSLATAELASAQYKEARANLERAIALKPDFAVAYMRLAQLFELQGNINEAISALEKGLNSASGNAEYLMQLGRYYYNRKQKGDYPLAEAAFRQALVFNPGYSDAMFGLAVLYETTGNKSTALELYRRLLELNPGNKEVLRRINAISPPPAPVAELPDAKDAKR